MQMPHIDYYLTTLSPYTYLAKDRLEQIAIKHNATITYKPCDIFGLFARTGGLPPKERHPNRQAYRLQDLERRARLVDMPFNLQPAHWPTNQAPSCYAIIAAQQAGGGDVGALVRSFLQAVWAGEEDIAEDSVVQRCLKDAGFDPDLALSGLLAGAEQFAQNLEDAVNAGVFGAPFYVTDDGAKFWGQDRLADLDAHLGTRA